jgi:hypothetical protein
LYFADGMVEEIITTFRAPAGSDARRKRSQGRIVGRMTATHRVAATLAADMGWMSLVGQPGKTGHRYCTAGLSSAAELFTGGRQRRSVPTANIPLAIEQLAWADLSG